jgi:HK97 family phage portal protein
MGMWSRWFGGNGGDTVQTGYQDSNPPTKSVSFDQAMSLSAFWASVRLLSETVAAMPLNCYDRDIKSNVKTINTDYELWRLLNYNPNRYQTRTEFFEQIMLNLVTRGNAYVAIEKTSRGRIYSLIPLPSAQVETVLLDDGAITYQQTTANGNVKIFAETSIWHIKLFGNGIEGLSTLEYAGNALGQAMDLNNRASVLASNGGKTNGILTVDQALKKEQKEAIKKSFSGLQSGNQDQLFVLEAGFDYKSTSLSPTDMQLLESRRFSIEDIARFMGVPSVLINDTSATTTWGSGIEQINQGFYKLNLKPYLERIESSIKRWLMPQSDWESIDIEFNFDSLLRADAATRAEANSKRINSGQNTPNEVRAAEGFEPKAGGDDIYLNGSLTPAGQQAQPQVVDNGN